MSWLALVAWLAGGPAPADARPIDADELARLAGHAVVRVRDRYRIVDVAGEGAPRVGLIERRGAELWLIEQDGAAHRLSGPLAVPRIAGPGYTVWIIGDLGADGALAARRLGVLARPRR